MPLALAAAIIASYCDCVTDLVVLADTLPDVASALSLAINLMLEAFFAPIPRALPTPDLASPGDSLAASAAPLPREARSTAPAATAPPTLSAVLLFFLGAADFVRRPPGRFFIPDGTVKFAGAFAFAAAVTRRAPYIRVSASFISGLAVPLLERALVIPIVLILSIVACDTLILAVFFPPPDEFVVAIAIVVTISPCLPNMRHLVFLWIYYLRVLL
jgi:hypothetical protein